MTHYYKKGNRYVHITPAHLDSYDPWFNLAVEGVYFSPDAGYAARSGFWRNADTVVINVRRTRGKSVPGGWKKITSAWRGAEAVAVQCSNDPAIPVLPLWLVPEYDKTISTSIVLNALNALGASAPKLPRNDLVVKPPKAIAKPGSGLYRETKIVASTTALCCSSDLSRLANYLNPDKRNRRRKVLPSVRSFAHHPTELLPGITHEQAYEAINRGLFRPLWRARGSGNSSPGQNARLAKLH